jgi:hypothetical protein
VPELCFTISQCKEKYKDNLPIACFHELQEFKKMLLIISFGLNAKLALVAGVCDNGTSEVDSIDWIQVGIIVLIQNLKSNF